jgi:hypothetical protein
MMVVFVVMANTNKQVMSMRVFVGKVEPVVIAFFSFSHASL